jgi:hypothetical protein
LLCNTNTSAASTQEDGAVVFDVHTTSPDGIDKTTDNHGTSSLDVIVEARVGIPISLESWEGILEILKLDHDAVT